MSHSPLPKTISFTLLSCLLFPGVLHAQDGGKKPAAKEKKAPIEISDEPKTVDPAQHIPKKLAVAATVDFTESSLLEVAEWIQKERKMPVLFDNKALSEKGIPLGEPVSDRLNNEPVYLLLNRLRSLELAWYVEDDILHITTLQVAKTRMSTKPYNVGDLLDAGYVPASIGETIREATAGFWEEEEDEDENPEGGGTQWLGDVLFVRQTDQMHRQIAGLLAALRKHGRQTYSFDPPQHTILRQKLNQNVSVKFSNTPLVNAVKDLAKQTGADIRLDKSALRASRIREREPVTLTLPDRKLSTTLHVLLADLNLTWILRDGVLWITSVERAKQHQKTAVYDVRDLCRDDEESMALLEAIYSQTAGPWNEYDDLDEEDEMGGAISFAKTGTMVILQTERGLSEVRELLATYRNALLTSKRRKRYEDDPQEVITRYYRMNASIADDLTKLLPHLVGLKTWNGKKKPEAAEKILKLSSEPGLIADESKKQAVVVSRSVLVIQQTRAVHEEIEKIIKRIENGDRPMFGGGFGGGQGGEGGGGGGFGGGFFSSRQAVAPQKGKK